MERRERMRRIRFELTAAAAVIAAAVLAGGCASGGGGKTDIKQEETAGMETPGPQPPESGPTQAELEKAEGAAALVGGYQLIADYGLCAPGDYQAYQMPRSIRPVIEENQVRAELLTAVHINGEFRFRLKIEDSTVTFLTPEEVKAVREREEKNKELAGQDGELLPDGDYVEIDRDKGLYGRSAYEERLRAEDGSGGGTLSVRLTGTGVAEGGCAPTRSSATRQYVASDESESGCLLTVGEYAMQGKPLQAERPEGTYKLQVPGFEQELEFTLEPVQEYGSPLEVPGMQERGNYLIWTSGRQYGDQVDVQYFVIPGEDEADYRCSFLECKLDYTVDGKTESCGHAVQSGGGGLNEPLSSIPAYRMSVKRTYARPNTEEGGNYTLSLGNLMISTPETSEEIVLPIPDDAETLDRELAFEDCTVRLLKIERREEPELYTISDEGDVLRPVVYIEVQVTDRSPDRHLVSIMGTKEGSDPYASEVRPNIERVEKSYQSAQVKGLTIFYDEGDTEVRFRLERLQYVEDLAVELPVVMEE